MSTKIFIISGLGADERVFQKIDFGSFQPIHIKWLIPEKDESIESYSKKLLTQIDEINPIIIGLSFGGIVAVEIAKQIQVKKIILISSAKTKKEIPIYYRLAGTLRLYKILPIQLLKKSNFATNWFFGVKTDFEKKILKQILLETNSLFLKWAIEKIILWKNELIITNYIHIHGSGDKILPMNFIENYVKIENGGHMMILNKPKELSKIIVEELTKINF